MYRENKKSLNAFVGCNFDCVYCRPSFQRLLKRQPCDLCKSYSPHLHWNRLDKKSPKTSGDEFVFFPSTGDPSFASFQELHRLLQYVANNSQTKFLMQTKNPRMFIDYMLKLGFVKSIDVFPKNLLIGTTLESDITFFDTKSKYTRYPEISKAPSNAYRAFHMVNIKHPKIVTVEPILDFNSERFEIWIRQINPKIVYIGYDNHQCLLPEPPLEKTLQFIEELKKFTEVRLKTIRKAWFEDV